LDHYPGPAAAQFKSGLCGGQRVPEIITKTPRRINP
jgi:hypothetical protein